jgi:hypothetical protein
MPEAPPPSAVAAGVVPLFPVPPQLAHLFASDWSARWFASKHRAKLVGCGALLMHRGQWHVDLAPFEAAWREISAEAARAQLGREVA